MKKILFRFNFLSDVGSRTYYNITICSFPPTAPLLQLNICVYTLQHLKIYNVCAPEKHFKFSVIRPTSLNILPSSEPLWTVWLNDCFWRKSVENVGKVLYIWANLYFTLQCMINKGQFKTISEELVYTSASNVLSECAC